MLATCRKCEDSEMHLGVMSKLATRCIFARQSEEYKLNECLMSLFKKDEVNKKALSWPDL